MKDRIPAEAFPPGDLIRDELKARDWTQAVLADITGRSPSAVNDVITGKTKITEEMSKALGEAFGVSPGFFLRLQVNFDSASLTPQQGEGTRRAAVYTKAPVLEMVKRGWIVTSKQIDDLERAVCRFLGIESLDEEPEVPGFAMRLGVNATFNCSHRAWLMRVTQLGKSAPAGAFSAKRFDEGLAILRTLTTSVEDARKVPGVLEKMGIRFVIVEHLPKTRIDGVCLWLSPKAPVVAMSLRYERLDQFWHTLMHELGHVRAGDGLNTDAYLDVDLLKLASEQVDDRPEAEKRADKFASEALIPPDELHNFIARVRPLYSAASIQGFADRIGVHESIVIGQLQHLREIPFVHSTKRIASCGVRDTLKEVALTDGWGHVVSPRPSD